MIVHQPPNKTREVSVSPVRGGVEGLSFEAKVNLELVFGTDMSFNVVGTRLACLSCLPGNREST